MDKEMFLKQYVVDRHDTCSAKWDSMQEKFGESDLISIWIADMEFKTCDAIVEALTERCRHGVFGYTRVPDGYYQAFSDWMETRYQFPVKRDWVRFSTGCVTAIAWMIYAFTQPGDACMILTPVYYPFHNVVTNNGRRLVKVGLHYEDGYFTMDYDAIEKAITENRVKLFLQCSPHNPAGRVWTKEELGRQLPGVTVCALEGTYLAFLDMRPYIKPEEIQAVIQGRCRLAVDYGEWFGDGCRGFIRMNLATDPAYVREAVGNLAGELKKGKA